MFGKICGVSFDLWDTLISDSALSRRQKQRRRLAALSRYGDNQDARTAALARRYQQESSANGIATRGISLEMRARLLLAELGGPARDARALAAALSRTALAAPPDVVLGAAELLGALVRHGPVTVVTNTTWTSGRTARAIIDRLGLGRMVSTLVSSDEIGRAKPSPSPFQAVWQPLGIAPHETVHVGDSVRRDHAGARSVGAASVISRVVNAAREVGESEADAICWDYAALPDLLRYLGTGARPAGWELVGEGEPIGGTIVAGCAVAGSLAGAPARSGEVALWPGHRTADPARLRSAVAILSEHRSAGAEERARARQWDMTHVIGLVRVADRFRPDDRLVVDGRKGLVWRYGKAGARFT